MTGPAHRAIGSCLILILIGSLIPETAQAEGGSRDRDKPIRLYATAAFGPIGWLAWNSPGSRVAINGSLADGEQAIWNGDVIETTAGTNVRVLLDSVGQVTLVSGARVRLATTLTRLDDDVTRRVLIASLTSGDMLVNLQQEAAAYVEACGSAYTSSCGAGFRIGIRDGHAMVDIVTGTVRTRLEEDVVTVKSVDVSTLQQMKAKERRTGHWLVRRKRARTIRNVLFTSNTDTIDAPAGQDEEPVPNRRVRFKYDPAVIRFDQDILTTNSAGEVNNGFTAGDNQGRTHLTVTLDDKGTNEKIISWEGDIVVKPRGVPLKNILIPAAAAVALIVIFIPKDGNKGPVRLGQTTSKP